MRVHNLEQAVLTVGTYLEAAIALAFRAPLFRDLARFFREEYLGQELSVSHLPARLRRSLF